MSFIRSPKLKYFAAIMAVIAIVAGVYFTFFQSRGFEKTKATIVSIEEGETVFEDDAPDYTVTVEYEVDGKKYSNVLDYYSGSFKVGKVIDITYDPNNPNIIHGGQGFGLYLIAAGVVILVVVVFSSVRSRKMMKETFEYQESHGMTGYAPSSLGEERELYFLTDTGTPKYGHRIEDADRRVLYEAKMTKFTLTSPFGFDFIDHVRGTTTPHLVGHTESSEFDTFLIDNYYTFTLDGEDIWKHLKRNGIDIQSNYDSGNGRLIGMTHRVLRDGVEMALIQSSSYYVHEEDAEKRKIRSALTAQGFYRIWTREQNLDLLFVTVLAFARSGAADDSGGTYGAIAGTINKKFNK